MEDKVKEALKAWNEFIQGYLLARNGWEEFTEQIRVNRILLEEFPIEAQRAMSRCNPKAKFTVALPRFADHIRGYMDADKLIFPIPEEEEEKKPKLEKPMPVIVSKEMKDTAKAMVEEEKPKNKRTLKGE